MEALDRWREATQGGAPFHLIITDVVMPLMSGPEMVLLPSTLARRRPPSLLSSTSSPQLRASPGVVQAGGSTRGTR